MFFCELHNLLLLSLSLIWAPFSLRDKDNFDLLKDLSKDKWKKILFTLFTLISCFSFFTGSKRSIRKIFNLIKNKKSQHPSLNGKEFIKRSGIRVTPDLSFKLKINNLYKKKHTTTYTRIRQSHCFKPKPAILTVKCDPLPAGLFMKFSTYELWTYFTIRKKLQWFNTLLNQSYITKERPYIVKVSLILAKVHEYINKRSRGHIAH